MTISYQLRQLGLILEDKTGHLFYARDFQPLKLTTKIVIVRHGETFGNCGQITHHGEIDYEAVNLGIKDDNKRVFQGNVNLPINQLTAFGKQQAEMAAKMIHEEFITCGFIPDIIFHSPLTRAKETGLPFVINYGFENNYFPYDDIKELSFGAWENKRLCDIEPSHACHLFYREQNALIKEPGINSSSSGESFAELILRAHQSLLTLNTRYAQKKILLFSHSMFGAACLILLGKGQTIEDGNYLAFDGKRKNGTPYTLPHARPFLLNSSHL